MITIYLNRAYERGWEHSDLQPICHLRRWAEPPISV